MIHKSALKLFPSMESSPDYKGVLAKCLLFSRHMFKQVEDEYIRGCLRILYKLPVRGLKRRSDGTSVISEEKLASSLVRWVKPNQNIDDDLAEHMTSLIQIEPHIACIAPPFKTGHYFVVMNRTVSISVLNSIAAIDILFKTFKVLGTPVPSNLAMVMDFFECVLYRTSGHSSRKSVNNLVQSFQDAAHAEDN
ncbi:uncharacterized protein LOC110680666 [Aedes aegypti]|nr:uncharacterized protein LOC110680666 [Aedes aegypti]